MQALLTFVAPVAALAFAPALRSVINRTKAVFAGRLGPPLLQPYRDLAKLLRKGAVYSTTTTWVFRAGPIVSLSTLLVATALVPFAGIDAPLSFTGDLLLLVYALALGRFFMILAALDTGSAFEGMGANREVMFAALAEPVLLLALAALARESEAWSLSTIYATMDISVAMHAPAALVLSAASLFVISLVENSRIPIDDPTTHLELTMIHEVMVLDHGGPDLAFIEYAQALKLWLFSQLLVGLIVPSNLSPATAIASGLLGTFVLGVTIGAVESSMARLRMNKVPQLLFGAGALATLAVLLEVI